MTDIIKKLEAKLERDRAARLRTLGRLGTLNDAIDKTMQALDVARALQSVEAGARVRFEYGRGESRRQEVGTVIAVDDSAGVRYKVQTGEGFDAKLSVIFQSQVVEVLGNV